MTPQIPCAQCQQTMEAKFQPGLRKGKSGYHLITCLNPLCLLEGFTFADVNYPPLNLDAYFESGRKRLAKLVKS